MNARTNRPPCLFATGTKLTTIKTHLVDQDDDETRRQAVLGDIATVLGSQYQEQEGWVFNVGIERNGASGFYTTEEMAGCFQVALQPEQADDDSFPLIPGHRYRDCNGDAWVFIGWDKDNCLTFCRPFSGDIVHYGPLRFEESFCEYLGDSGAEGCEACNMMDIEDFEGEGNGEYRFTPPQPLSATIAKLIETCTDLTNQFEATPNKDAVLVSWKLVFEAREILRQIKEAAVQATQLQQPEFHSMLGADDLGDHE